MKNFKLFRHWVRYSLRNRLATTYFMMATSKCAEGNVCCSLSIYLQLCGNERDRRHFEPSKWRSKQ